jgi:hypothetical protein
VNIVAEDLTIKASDHAGKMQAFGKNQNGEEKHGSQIRAFG